MRLSRSSARALSHYLVPNQSFHPTRQNTAVRVNFPLGVSLEDAEKPMELGEDWQQHYPTYKFKDDAIVLAEYNAASALIDAEERLFTNSANIVLLVAAGVGSLVFGSLPTVYDRLTPFISHEGVAAALTLLLSTLTLLTVKHFTERQKTILFAKRKIVVLRRMLGLDYGRFQLVLPNWRVEGANQPFAIRLFPGWLSFVAYPFWVISIFSTTSLFVLLAHYFDSWHPISTVAPERLAFLGAIGWFAVLAIIFRTSLYDTHEGFRLSIARAAAKLLRVPLVPDFEYVIYRAQLAVFENQRLDVDTTNIRPLLIFLEDRGFLNHRGVSFRGMARAFRDYATRRRISGGSTITQQITRSLFIAAPGMLFRRKIVELLMAIWCEATFTKREILDLYLVSVRYAERVYGWLEAGTHFFRRLVTRPTKAEAFFLLERISNIRNRVLISRIDQLIRQAVDGGLMADSDAAALSRLYSEAVNQGQLVVTDQESFDRFLNTWAGRRADT